MQLYFIRGEKSVQTAAASFVIRSAYRRTEPQHIDVVARRSGLAPSVASGTLALLELKGLVRDVGGMQFVRVREPSAEYDLAEPARAE